jgi:small-conductance mechanosensitive channel
MKRRQATGIVGMVLAMLGGIAWFYGQYTPAIILWIGAAGIVFNLNKRKTKNRAHR